MQTFLPYRNLEKTFACLDQKRLFNQLSEVKVISKALLDPSAPWGHHPATLMWRGFYPALQAYAYPLCLAIKAHPSCKTPPTDDIVAGFKAFYDAEPDFPGWCSSGTFRLLHQMNLMRKDPDHYVFRLPSGTPPGREYCWPLWNGDVWVMRLKQVGASKYYREGSLFPFRDYVTPFAFMTWRDAITSSIYPTSEDTPPLMSARLDG